MRNLFNSIILFLSAYTIQAQEYGVYSMHFVRIEGDTENFEKVQALYMKKVAKQAAEKGDISFWAFLKHVPMDNINDEERYNYLFSSQMLILKQCLVIKIVGGIKRMQY